MTPLRVAPAVVLSVVLCLLTGTLPASAEGAAAPRDHGILRIPASVLSDPDLTLRVDVPRREGGGATASADSSWIVPGEEYVEMQVTGRRIVFLTRGSNPGPTILTYYPGVSDDRDATIVEVKAGETVTLQHFDPIIGATAEGRVSTQDRTSLRGRLEVEAFPVDVNGTLGDPQTAPVDAAGRFRAQGLSDGLTVFRVLGRGAADRSPLNSPYRATWAGDTTTAAAARRFVVSRRGAPTDVGTVTMVDAATLSGRVVDPEGIGVPGAVVTSSDRWGRLITDADGRWDAGGVGEGLQTIEVEDPSQHVRSARTTVDVQAGRPSAVEISPPFQGPSWVTNPTWDAPRHAPRQGTPITVDPGVLRQPDARVVDISWVTGEPVFLVGSGPRYTPPPGLNADTQLYAIVTTERKGIRASTIAGNNEVRPVYPFADMLKRDDGPPVVHEVRSAGARPASSSRTKKRYQWMRDGRKISSAKARTYRVAPADRGHRLSVRTTTTKPDGRVSRRSSDPETVERGSTIIQPDFVTTGRGEILATAQVGVPNVGRQYLDGSVVVERLDRDGPTEVARFRVSDSRGAARFESHATGRQTYRMVFTPSRTTMSGVTSVRVPVLGSDQAVSYEDSPWGPWIRSELYGEEPDL